MATNKIIITGTIASIDHSGIQQITRFCPSAIGTVAVFRGWIFGISVGQHVTLEAKVISMDDDGTFNIFDAKIS